MKRRERLACEDAEYLILDATEQPIQRPKKGQKKYYSGKKKRHTVKTQYVVNSDGKIESVSPYEGKKHDFDIYKSQKKRDKFHGVPKKADSGYQGINKYDKKQKLLLKNPKKEN